MNICSKKTSINNNKVSSHHGKGLKRSKSTQHLIPKKTTKKNLQRKGSEENFYTNSLTKTKSSKSLKGKVKHQTKSEHSTKKSKPKKCLDTKTVKKYNHLESREANSILTLTEDADPKQITKEYFIYCNKYIPIENSAQRRLVYKIQMIDLENKTTTNNFYRPRYETQQVETQQVETKEIAIGEKIENQNQQIQTQLLKTQKFEQSIQKCFVDVLTDLEFLYLPNQAIFQPFTQHQRTHYGEMLQALAKKMLAGNKNLVVTNSLTDEQITVLLYQREGIQIGALQFIPLQGFPTHLLSILAYLKNLFCYIQYSHKEEVLAKLRMFYGLNYYDRIAKLSKRQPHVKDARVVLSNQIFQAFEYEMFKDYQFASETAKEAVHSHNKAIFDSVNDQLQVFRPFYTSEGEPFPWTTNLGMTHYDITEQALFIIFVQAKENIQKQVITLCGMHIDFDDQALPNPHLSKLYTKKMQEKQKKMVSEEARQYDDKVELDYLISGLKFDLAQEIFFQLINQLQMDFFQDNQEEVLEEDYDFQYFD